MGTRFSQSDTSSPNLYNSQTRKELPAARIPAIEKLWGKLPRAILKMDAFLDTSGWQIRNLRMLLYHSPDKYQVAILLFRKYMLQRCATPVVCVSM